jgi:hypothetical protein
VDAGTVAAKAVTVSGSVPFGIEKQKGRNVITETIVIAAPVAGIVALGVKSPAAMKAKAGAAQLSQAGVILAKDKRLPRWFRIVLGVACLPIPGPVDNAVQVLALGLLLTRYRTPTVEAWKAAERPNTAVLSAFEPSQVVKAS